MEKGFPYRGGYATDGGSFSPIVPCSPSPKPFTFFTIGVPGDPHPWREEHPYRTSVACVTVGFSSSSWSRS